MTRMNDQIPRISHKSKFRNTIRIRIQMYIHTNINYSDVHGHKYQNDHTYTHTYKKEFRVYHSLCCVIVHG